MKSDIHLTWSHVVMLHETSRSNIARAWLGAAGVGYTTAAARAQPSRHEWYHLPETSGSRGGGKRSLVPAPAFS